MESHVRTRGECKGERMALFLSLTLFWVESHSGGSSLFFSVSSLTREEKLSPQGRLYLLSSRDVLVLVALLLSVAVLVTACFPILAISVIFRAPDYCTPLPLRTYMIFIY